MLVSTQRQGHEFVLRREKKRYLIIVQILAVEKRMSAAHSYLDNERMQTTMVTRNSRYQSTRRDPSDTYRTHVIRRHALAN